MIVTLSIIAIAEFIVGVFIQLNIVAAMTKENFLPTKILFPIFNLLAAHYIFVMEWHRDNADWHIAALGGMVACGAIVIYAYRDFWKFSEAKKK